MLRAEQEFEAARARTLSQVSVEHGEIIKRYRFVRLNGHAGRWADTDAVKFIIRLNTDMCELPKQEQDIIIAHEWGHAISFLHYPKLLEERRSNIQMHSEETYERIANVYAVTIYPNEKVDQALTFMETLCKQDRPYQCQRVAAWRQGIGRYN